MLQERQPVRRYDIPAALLDNGMQQREAVMHASSFHMPNVLLLLQHMCKLAVCIARVQEGCSWIVGADSFKQAAILLRTVYCV